jgi:hypothetical protein
LGQPSSKDANSQFSTFVGSLALNNQIAGMAISSSSISVVGGSISYSQPNLALILGICIPVGTLLIAGIILFFYCRKRKSSEAMEKHVIDDSGVTGREEFELSAKYNDTGRPIEGSIN